MPILELRKVLTSRIGSTLAAAALDLPEEFWEELEALVPSPENWLDGHPADLDVIVRLLEPDGRVRDLVHLFGGEGTLNVASWAPDSRRLAYVAYPTSRPVTGGA